jgi:hypothetical protein
MDELARHIPSARLRWNRREAFLRNRVNQQLIDFLMRLPRAQSLLRQATCRLCRLCRLPASLREPAASCLVLSSSSFSLYPPRGGAPLCRFSLFALRYLPEEVVGPGSYQSQFPPELKDETSGE